MQRWCPRRPRCSGASRNQQPGGIVSKTVTAGMSRREFLIAANAGALLLLLESCSLGPIGRSNASPPPGGSARQQALRLLRDAIRASPDHLTQRSADLVAAKDDTKIVEFVRDRLGVVPVPHNLHDLGVILRRDEVGGPL